MVNSTLNIEKGKDSIPTEGNCLAEDHSYDSNYCVRSVYKIVKWSKQFKVLYIHKNVTVHTHLVVNYYTKC